LILPLKLGRVDLQTCGMMERQSSAAPAHDGFLPALCSNQFIPHLHHLELDIEILHFIASSLSAWIQ
jgi:hypothetical protein